jgi:hypothetical protein
MPPDRRFPGRAEAGRQGDLSRPQGPSAGRYHRQADDRRLDAGGFELKGGKEAAFALQNALEVVRISNNLGDAKSLITHPATTTHKNLTDEARAELGISAPGTVRLSAGIEDVGRSDRGFRGRAIVSVASARPVVK